jgi:hypothetical protein
MTLKTAIREAAREAAALRVQMGVVEFPGGRCVPVRREWLDGLPNDAAFWNQSPHYVGDVDADGNLYTEW